MNYISYLHYASLAVFSWIFGYAGLYKVLKMPGMMKSMESLGFTEGQTLLIGVAEVLGVAGIIAGLFVSYVKNISVLFLLPFAIGAFTVHISYQHDFGHYRNSLLVCILPVIILLTDKSFRISL